MNFKTIKEVEEILKGLDDSESIKQAAKMLAPAEAFCELFRHSLRDQILATRCNVIARETIKLGHKVVEKSLDRQSRSSKDYLEAQDMYSEALKLKIYLKTYLAGVKMSHESALAKERRTTAEVRAGIYHKGS